ncbi:receptor-like protein 12 [Solanum tuberosum]|nr:PREDICTED: receptor-like protein 12 [Solanum tuberosum]
MEKWGRNPNWEISLNCQAIWSSQSRRPDGITLHERSHSDPPRSRPSSTNAKEAPEDSKQQIPRHKNIHPMDPWNPEHTNYYPTKLDVSDSMESSKYGFEVSVTRHPLKELISQLTYAGKHLCARDEAFYLLEFKQGLIVGRNDYYNGCDSKAQAKTLSWNVTGDCCEWDGVTCNGFTGHFDASFGNLTRIRVLKLSFNNLNGNVLSTISKLNKLDHLDLSYNDFQGSIPESFGNLTRIRSLDLSMNIFTGNVPSTIGKLNKLHSLSLSSNNFEGLIPNIFSNFSELSFLAFDTNNFTGPLPYSIATLTRLEILYLQNNLLTGPLPSNISGLQELQQLDLSFNYFTGATPPWLFHLPSLLSLYVQDNQLTGKLPNKLKSNYLEYFNIRLSYNKLQGEIPDWMFSTSIVRLDLSHNFLTGFKKQVWHSDSLQYLNLENNFLQGTLHQSFCDMHNLDFLILAQNNFSGSIPDCLGNSNSFISILDLRMNSFHGEIPRILPTTLQYLGLYGNQLRGQVPRSLVNCTSLEALDLGNNKINDTFPIWLEKLPNLQVLILKSNLFHGSIGDLESEFPFPELRIFDLSFNGFTGTLSSNFFKSFRGMMDVDEEKTGITRERTSNDTDYLYHISLVIKGNEFDMRITSIMTSVDLSSNRFEGDIPKSIGNLSSLVLLNLSHNNFRGHIPAEIAKVQALEALDLSWNRLIGEIPGPLSSSTFLEVLNLSYNHLAGHIPIGKQFNTFPNDSYCGNPDLCGFPLSKECGNNNESPLEHDDDDDSFFMSGFTWEAVVIGYGCGMIFGLLIGGLMFLLEKPKWYVNFAEDIQIDANKQTRQKKRRQRRCLRMN